MVARVTQRGSDWIVTNEGRLIGVYPSNREAWRVADKVNGEFQGRSEETAQWSFDKSANGQ